MITCSCDVPNWISSALMAMVSAPMIGLNIWLFWRMRLSMRREYLPRTPGTKNPTGSWAVFLAANAGFLSYLAAAFVLLYFNVRFYL